MGSQPKVVWVYAQSIITLMTNDFSPVAAVTSSCPQLLRQSAEGDSA